MKKKLEEVKKKILTLKKFGIKQIPQGINTHTNSLATLASTISTKLKMKIYVSCLSNPIITGGEDKVSEKNLPTSPLRSIINTLLEIAHPWDSNSST